MENTGNFLAGLPLFILAVAECRWAVTYLLKRPATIARIKSRAKHHVTEEETKRWCKNSGALNLATAVCAFMAAVFAATQPFFVTLGPLGAGLVLSIANTIYTKNKTGALFL